jgi:transposase
MQPKDKAAKRSIDRSKDGMATKVHAICDEKGRTRKISITAGNIIDFNGAHTLLTCADLPPATAVIADCGCDAQWIKDLIHSHGMESCIPSQCIVKVPANSSKSLYATRHMVENFFAKLKDWRRIATRYDHCPRNFLASVLLASSFISFLFLCGRTPSNE